MGLGKAMKQFQKMQADMKKMQVELESKRVSATAGGGMVEVVVNGNRRITEVKINPEVVDPQDVETLGDLLQAAANEALRQAEKLFTEQMQGIAGGLQLPPGLV